MNNEPEIMEDLSFLERVGIPVIRDDEVGYQRAKKFSESLNLSPIQFGTVPGFIYNGKVFINQKGEI